MASNGEMGRHIRLIFVILFLLAFAPCLSAQVGSYTMEIQFIQHFAWNQDEHTRRYEVIMEREENGEYVDHYDAFINEPWINLSLMPGNYRYKVIPYDLLNHPEEGTDWIDIQVHAALVPETDNIFPGVLRLDERPEYVINISGKNIEADAEFDLQRPGGVTIVPYDKNVSEDGNKADLFFTREQLTPGIYEVNIKNQSGIKAKGGEVTIAFPDPPPRTAFLNTLGVSVGSTFTAPVYIAGVFGTYSPLRNSFLQVGFDFGMESAKTDIGYFSLYPFVHYALFLPFTPPERDGVAARKGVGGWYIGAGGGFILAQYNFPEGDVPVRTFTAAVVTGVNLFNFLDISYTLRTGFGESGYKGIDHKVAVGYTYRFI